MNDYELEHGLFNKRREAGKGEERKGHKYLFRKWDETKKKWKYFYNTSITGEEYERQAKVRAESAKRNDVLAKNARNRAPGFREKSQMYKARSRNTASIASYEADKAKQLRAESHLPKNILKSREIGKEASRLERVSASTQKIADKQMKDSKTYDDLWYRNNRDADVYKQKAKDDRAASQAAAEAAQAALIPAAKNFVNSLFGKSTKELTNEVQTSQQATTTTSDLKKKKG